MCDDGVTLDVATSHPPPNAAKIAGHHQPAHTNTAIAVPSATMARNSNHLCRKLDSLHKRQISSQKRFNGLLVPNTPIASYIDVDTILPQIGDEANKTILIK
jgi:hypothetical protein